MSHSNLLSMGSVDPLSCLYFSDSEDQVYNIRVSDEESRLSYVNVEYRGCQPQESLILEPT